MMIGISIYASIVVPFNGGAISARPACTKKACPENSRENNKIFLAILK